MKHNNPLFETGFFDQKRSTHRTNVTDDNVRNQDRHKYDDLLNPEDYHNGQVPTANNAYNTYSSGHTQLYIAQTYQTDIPLDFSVSDVIDNSLSIYVNGEGRDYEVIDDRTVKLRYPIQSGDEKELEIRCKLDITSTTLRKSVLLLPREYGKTVFTDEQLTELMPELGNVFQFSKLLRFGNEELASESDKEGRVVSVYIDRQGIKGTLQINHH